MYIVKGIIIQGVGKFMIVVSSDEIIAMNDLLDGAPIEGLAIQTSEELEEARLKKVNKSLTEKEFLIDGKLSDKFMATAELLKRYKESEHKIFINNLRIALVDESRTIVLELLPNGDITFSYTPRLVVVKKYIEAAEFLRGEQEVSFSDDEKEPYTDEAYEEDLNRKEWSNVMVVQTYVKQRMTLFQTYYFDDKEAYCFDHLEKTKWQRGPNDFTTDLINLFEIIEEGEVDGQT